MKMPEWNVTRMVGRSGGSGGGGGDGEEEGEGTSSENGEIEEKW